MVLDLLVKFLGPFGLFPIDTTWFNLLLSNVLQVVSWNLASGALVQSSETKLS